MKALLKAGILSEDGARRHTVTGAPQGGILSPLLSNLALSVLDEHFARAWQAMGSASNRVRRHHRGLPSYRLVRYADDWVVLVHGTRAHADTLREEAAAVLAPIGLRLSEEKTRIAHIDEGSGRAGARYRRCRWPVSPARPPNRTCPFPSIRLSTGHAVADRGAGQAAAVSGRVVARPVAVVAHGEGMR